LGFLQNRDSVTLLAVTSDSVVSYHTSTSSRITEVTNKKKNAPSTLTTVFLFLSFQQEELDDKGCELGCAVMGDEHDLSVGRKEVS